MDLDKLTEELFEQYNEEHMLKKMVDDVNRTEDTTIIQNFDKANKLFEVIKKTGFELEKHEETQSTEVVPYLVLTHFDVAGYTAKIIAPVFFDQNDAKAMEKMNTLERMITEHLSGITGEIKPLVRNESEAGLVSYTIEADATTHKATFRSKINDIIKGLDKLDKKSELAKAGFTTKSVVLEV
jgi:hypothetical protein